MPPLKVFERTIAIQPEDIHGGHVNNVKFFAYIGETFQDWYGAMGLDSLSGEPLMEGPLMAHLEYDYFREMDYPGAVLCRLTVSKVGRSSLEHDIEIRDARQPDVLCGRGKGVNVWFDRNIGKAAPWPEAMLAKCWAA